MNKEIEELLDKLKDKDWYDELDLTGTRWIELKQEETNLLLSYIEQLEDKINWYENIDINKTIDKFRVKHNEEIKELHNKIEQLENNRDKAYEFVKEKRKVFEWYDTDLFYLESLLKGGNDE